MISSAGGAEFGFLLRPRECPKEGFHNMYFRTRPQGKVNSCIRISVQSTLPTRLPSIHDGNHFFSQESSTGVMTSSSLISIWQPPCLLPVPLHDSLYSKYSKPAASLAAVSANFSVPLIKRCSTNFLTPYSIANF
jgi:hypothetical protein